MQEPEDVGKYQVNNDDTTQGQVIGDHNITHLHFYGSRDTTKSGPVWNVPYARNPYFTGRDELLDRLHQQLTQAEQNPLAKIGRVALTQPQAIKGLGGIGKTQIAVEYAYRSRDQRHYTHTLWVNAEGQETIITSFVTIAELLPAFPAKNGTDQQKLVEAVKHWLEQCEQPWLLIFDNADDVSLVRNFLPRQGKGSILLTTRAQATGPIDASSIEVENMGLREGTEFLLHRAQCQQASDEEQDAATNIAVALDCFPLALDQAGAYINETKCGFAVYLKLYQDHRKAMLTQRGTPATDYPKSVATTWSLSFRKVEEANPAAAQLLQLCAFLAPDRIPEELITDGATHWPFLLQKAATDLLLFQQMIAELLKFSLVERFSEAQILKTLRIHRLVQVVQKDAMEQEVQYQWAEKVVQAVSQVFPAEPDDIIALPQCRRYLDQVQVCSTLIEDYTLLLDEGADLLDRASVYLGKHALYSIAEPLEQHAQTIREQLLKVPLSKAALSKNNRAEHYRGQGKYKEAEPLYLSALADFERVDPTHTDTAVCLSNLALLYCEQERYEEAEPLWSRALPILEQKLGDTHLKTISCINNLANLYYRLGKYEKAEPLYLRALAGWGQDERSPDVALILSNLGECYRIQNRYEEAIRLLEHALAIFENYEKELGDVHPNFAITLNNLALLYYKQEKYTAAEPLFERALAIFEQKLEDIHPDKAGGLSNLANLYFKLKKYEKAESLFKRALLNYEQIWGATHPYTQDLQKRYDLLLEDMQHDAEARDTEERS